MSVLSVIKVLKEVNVNDSQYGSALLTTRFEVPGEFKRRILTLETIQGVEYNDQSTRRYAFPKNHKCYEKPLLSPKGLEKRNFIEYRV